MARQSQAHDAIADFESGAERLAEWIRDHLWPVVGGVVLLLAVAAGIGGYSSYSRRQAEEASTAFDRVHADYMMAMGADPSDLVVPELANPNAAQAIREEYSAKFGEIAEAHPGTIAGALARWEEANLSEAAGDLETSVQLWRETLEGLPGHPEFQAILHERIARAYEDAERWADAAAAHEAAGAIESYPLRYWALADAARCWVAADDRAAARALALRVQTEAPDLQLPENLRALMQELRAAPTS